MNIPPINLKAQYKLVRKEIRTAINEILDEQRLILGKYCSTLEQQISDYAGVPCAVSCANGTDALILALMALDVKAGDEVITTPYTFFSTASSVAILGGKPVFVDIDETTMNINPTLIEKAITPRTKAITVVHLFGKVCDMGSIGAIAQRHDLYLIEDCAQSLGSRKNGVMSGAFGDIAATSFYPTKNLGGIGEGGMVYTKRADLGEKVKKLRVHGMGNQYFHEMIGLNSRLDEIKACALTAKFRHLESWNTKRRANAVYYNKQFRRLPLMLPVIEDDNSHIFHHYVIRTKRRDELQNFLKEHGVMTGVYYPLPLHLQPCFTYLGYKEGDFPIAEKSAKTSLALPIYPELKNVEREYVANCVKEFFKSA
jgi:dTDP-4-amino-4,6-dideoxygalactose transaminase